ncbi:MAG: HNH endonuclease signature motif containing protein [Desulfopila sp.]|jgi:5-methylcytosine-specific restriction endonuclease McrA|nr:HNH endonuclease signature motif containing protein [Desulfopila sp.]
MTDLYDFDGVSESEIRRQKAKARELRKTRWWQQKSGSSICWYCRKKVPPQDITMDHVVPLAQGGKSSKDNLVPACKNCNTKKKNMMPIQWQEFLDDNK